MMHISISTDSLNVYNSGPRTVPHKKKENKYIKSIETELNNNLSIMPYKSLMLHLSNIMSMYNKENICILNAIEIVKKNIDFQNTKKYSVQNIIECAELMKNTNNICTIIGRLSCDIILSTLSNIDAKQYYKCAESSFYKDIIVLKYIIDKSNRATINKEFMLLHETLIEMVGKYFGPYNIKLRLLLENAHNLYGYTNEFTLKNLEKLLAVVEFNMDTDCVDVGNILGYLAECLNKNKKLYDGYICILRCIAIYKKHSIENLNIINAYATFARICKQLNYMEKAFESSMAANLLIQKLLDGTNALEKNKIKKNYIGILLLLGEIYGIFHKKDEQKFHFEKAMTITKELFGDNSEEYARSLEFYASHFECSNEEELKQKIKMYEQSLNIKMSRNMNVLTREMSSTLSIMSVCYGAANDKIKQYECLKKSTELYEKYDPLHRDAGYTFGKMANYLFENFKNTEDLLSSEMYYNKCLNIYAESYGLYSSQYMLHFKSLIIVMIKLNKSEDAKNKAYKMIDELKTIKPDSEFINILKLIFK